MKKKIVLGLSIAALAFANVSFAMVTGQNALDRQAQKDAMQTQRDANMAQRQVNQTQRADLKTQRDATMQQRKTDRCEKIQARIAERLTNFDSIENKHMAVYTNMQDRIQKFIDRLTAAGVDTTKVKTDLADLQTKIAQFSTDYKTYVAALGDAKSFTCGDTDATTTTNVKTKMQAARAALVTVHQDAMAIRTFMQGTVVPDILALKKQAATTKAATETATADSTSTGAPELKQ